MSLPSASSLQLAALCPGSQALPRVGHVSAAATKGTEKHEELERDTEKADALLSEAGLTPIPGAEQIREAAYAYDADTGATRFLGYGRGAYATANLGAREIPGTLDYLERTETDAQVVDYKNGRAEFVPVAADSYQLGFAALVAERPRVRVAFVFTADETRPWARWADYDEFDLADWRSKMRRLADKVEAARAAVAAGAQPELNTGDHCRWCPARNNCPAQVSLIRAAVNMDIDVLKANVEALMPGEAGVALAKVNAYLKPLLALRDLIYGYAGTTPIPLGNGKELREVVTSRRELDGAIAETVLTEISGPEVARACIERSITQAAMKRVLPAAEFKRAMAALDVAGAISVKEYRSVREVDAKDVSA